MIRHLSIFLVAIFMAIAAPVVLFAQDGGAAVPTLDELIGVAPDEAAPEDVAPAETAVDEAAAEQAEEEAPVEGAATDSPAFNEEFESLALRAEELAAREDASLFAVARLRSQMVEWRDFFMAQTDVNAGRIATVEAQLAALGPVPESGEEAEVIANRRAALEAQRQDLIAPRLLAQEAFARADGIIGEFDMQILRRETAQLWVRGPSPLNPTHILDALADVSTLAQAVVAEIGARLAVESSNGSLRSVLPRALGLVVLGIALLWIGRRFITQWRATLADRHERWLPVALLLLSLVQILVPVAGLFLITSGLETTNLFGLRGGDIVAAIPLSGFLVVFAWWLARHIFPVGTAPGFLGYDQPTRAAGRRYTGVIGWVFAVGALLDAGLNTLDQSEGAVAAVEWPFLLAIGVLLWLLGRVIRTPPQAIEGQTVSTGRTRALVGQICILAGFSASLMAMFGYGAASRALLIPLVLSLSLIGVLLVLQRIVHDLSRIRPDDEEGRGLYALLPVFVSFVLFLLSLPLFALIWGASVDELFEVWAQFREGFALGETRISPTDFLTFVAVFAIGYLLTRFIQATLRKSVMPRTRFDLGGQNAVVAGFGYVGIILAAIIAITSAGIDLSNLAIVAGALSVGIGFGLQNIVSNFVSGIILLIERPVSEGDWIEVGGQMGYVRAISVRSTRIETFDRTDVIVPNADLVSNQVTNWTRGNLVGRVIVPVGVAYGTDVDKVTKILQGIAEAHPLVVGTPPPAVLFMGFGADSLDFEIRAILRDVNYVLVTKSEMNHEIARKFAEAGIEIPFAQRDIWLRNPEVLKEQPT